MNKKIFLLLMILLIIFTSIATFVVYFNTKLYQVEYLPVIVEVKNKIGLGIYDDPQLNFGIIPRGGASSRTFNITSSKDVNVVLLARGNVSRFITLPENKFFLPKDQIKKVPANIYVPLDTEFGNYSGRLLIILKNI